MSIEPIIPPVERELLLAELSKEHFIRTTRNGSNDIYIVNAHNAPNVMREIGRLREEAFRQGGGGTGLALDIDDHDTAEKCYQQLIVFNPDDQEITGGYRFILGPDAYDETTGKYNLSTGHYFNFTEEFEKDYLPHSIELGRSWVNAEYQFGNNPRKGLFALANLWDGLGALILGYPKMLYFFGKMTMYPSYSQEARNLLLHFMHYHFPDNQKLAVPIHPLTFEVDEVAFQERFGALEYKEGMRLLQKDIKALGEAIPPLIGIYMNLSPDMKTFGTAVNPDFGGVEETGIMVTIDNIYPDKKDQYMEMK